MEKKIPCRLRLLGMTGGEVLPQAIASGERFALFWVDLVTTNAASRCEPAFINRIRGRRRAVYKGILFPYTVFLR
jgi:hypothetical protein